MHLTNTWVTGKSLKDVFSFRAFIILFPFITSTVTAQFDVRFERITVEDGLSQSAITSMVQDKYGYLWIGTLDGLNRYDGSSFIVYRNTQNNPRSLPVHSITGLMLDRHDRLWVAHRNGISLYDPIHNNFRNYEIKGSEANLYIRELHLFSDSLAILCTNQGILNFNPINGQVIESKEFSFFKNRNTFSLFAIDDSETWVVADSVLWRKDNKSGWQEFYRSKKHIAAAYFKNTDELYVRTFQQLLKYDRTKDKLVEIANFPNAEDVNSPNLMKAFDGHLWVGHGGIYVFDSHDKLVKTLNHVAQDPNSLSGSFLSDLYQTKDGVIWAGTNGLGLNKYNPFRSVFSYIGNFPGAPLTLSDHYVTAVFTNDDIRVFVGTLGGLDIVDLTAGKSHHHELIGRDGNRAHALKIFEGTDKRIWLGTNKGLMFLDKTGVFPSGIKELDDPELSIYDRIEISPYTYVLTTNKNIVLWNEKKRTAQELFVNGSTVIARMNGKLWIEAGGQIKLLETDSQNITTFPKIGADSLLAPLTPIKCFLQDSDGGIWMGTNGGGLSFYDLARSRFAHFRENSGLSNNVVYGVLEDDAGFLWLSTNNGLCVFDRKTRKVIRSFNMTDGLQGNEFNTRAYFKSPSGKMYFGGINGLSFFDPADALAIPSFTPQTVLTGFYINNVRKDLQDGSVISEPGNANSIKLNWDERNFSFDIAGLGFTFPSGIRYQYKLENFDQDWNYVGNQTRITFTNVPIGNYTLRVKSGNSFGDWEDSGLSVNIQVKAPFWRAPLFMYSAAAFMLLSIYLFYIQRTFLLKKRAVHLQNVVEERTQEIHRQQVEIAGQNEELKAQAEKTEQHNSELEKVKESLEKRVEERTQTLSRLNDELFNQNTQLEQFAFITAHNIRGPVARIRGLVNLLSPGNDAEILRHLLTSVNNLDEVITDLNVVLNIKYGVNRFQELVSVKEQLLLAKETLRTDIESLKVKIDSSGFEDIKVYGLRPYFQSIFYNLIHNALKYSNNQNASYIKCYTDDGQDDKVKIVIEDNGIGIDMRYAKDKIFKLYQRFHSDVVGKGYGLFLVKTQIEAMRGTIKVESELGEGTKFIIEFPKSQPEINNDQQIVA